MIVLDRYEGGEISAWTFPWIYKENADTGKVLEIWGGGVTRMLERNAVSDAACKYLIFIYVGSCY